MKQLQSTALHWDSSFFIVSRDISFVCQEKTNKLLLGLEEYGVLLVEEVVENILEIIQILKCGPISYEQLSNLIKLELPQPLSLEVFLKELCDAQIIEVFKKGDFLHYLHQLTDDFVFREGFFEEKKYWSNSKQIKLPDIAVSATRNKSQRDFQNKPIRLEELSSLLGNSVGHQNIVNSSCLAERVVPSAGGIYGINILVFAQNIECIPKGVYFYNKQVNTLSLVREGDIPFENLFSTKHIDYQSSSCVISYVCDLSNYMWRYGKRGYRFVLIEAGHCAQSLLVEAKKQDVFCVPVGAHIEREIMDFINCETSVLYSVVCGKL